MLYVSRRRAGSVRIPAGPHLDALSDWQRKAIESKIPKMPG